MILEYMLVREMDVKRAPSWVEDGGYFFNPADNTFIGWTPDLANRDYYVPDTVVDLTRSQLKTRLLGIHSSNPFLGEDGEALITSEVEQRADNWCNVRGEY